MKPLGRYWTELATTSTPTRHRRAKAGRSRARQDARAAIRAELPTVAAPR